MGLFLSLSGVVGASSAEVVAALAEFSRKYSGYLRPAAAEEDDATRLVIASGRAGATVLYPGEFLGWDAASAFLSVRLAKPAFSFHIHDGDLWMYYLYVDGEAVTGFNPIPDYWGEMADEKLMRSDAALVAKHIPGLNPASIERYLVRWDLDSPSLEKAYPDDEFAIGEDWQLCDFLRKLGFVYPLDNHGKAIGECYSFHADTPP